MSWREMTPQHNPRVAKNEGWGSFRTPEDKLHCDAHGQDFAPDDRCACGAPPCCQCHCDYAEEW